MAPITPPANLQAASYPARIDRLDSAALLATHYTSGPLTSRPGVKPGSTATTGGMAVGPRGVPDRYVTVQPGTCYIQSTNLLGGTYIAHNDAAYDVQTAASHPTLPRIDLIVARVYDAVDDVGSQNTFTIEVVTGTPASSPVAPATPSQSLVLAQIAVAAASTTVTAGNITDTRNRVVALGGVLPCRGASDVPATPYPGMTIFREDLAQEQIWSGSAWLLIGGAFPKARIARTTNLSISSGSNATVTLGTVDYATTPTLVSGNTLIPTVAGQYEVTGHIQWASGTAGYYQGRILDGSGNALAGASGNVGSGVSAIMTCSTVANVTAAQVGTNAGTFSLSAFQNTGSSINITGAYLICRYIGPAI